MDALFKWGLCPCGRWRRVGGTTASHCLDTTRHCVTTVINLAAVWSMDAHTASAFECQLGLKNESWYKTFDII